MMIAEQIILMSNEATALLVSGENPEKATRLFQRALRIVRAVQESQPNDTKLELFGERLYWFSTDIPLQTQVTLDTSSGDLFYCHSQGIYVCTSASVPLRFLMICLLWNMALSTFQWASTLQTHSQGRANLLLLKAIHYYSHVVHYATIEEWDAQPSALTFLALAAQNNLSWICLQLGRLKQAVRAQEDLVALTSAHRRLFNPARNANYDGIFSEHYAFGHDGLLLGFAC